MFFSSCADRDQERILFTRQILLTRSDYLELFREKCKRKKELHIIPLQLPNASNYVNYSGCLVTREAIMFIRFVGVRGENST